MRSTLLSLVTVVLLPGLMPARAPAPPRRPGDTLDERVRESVQSGIKYLREQERDGKWEADAVKLHYPGGQTSLALLALLAAGVPPDEPVIQRGLKHLRSVPPERTYVVALQTIAFARAGDAQDRERIQRNADWLLAARLRDGWTYGKSPGGVRNVTTSDNSNTQYALLGLEAARRVGAKVDRNALAELRKFYLDTQADGGWRYRAGTPPSLSMTAAGLCGLLLTGRELDAGLRKLRADGSAENCGRYPDGRAADKALEWLGGHFPHRLTAESAPDRLGAPYYTLAAVGRAGRLSGRRYFGDADWYEVGARYLVATQKADGSWGGRPTRGRFPDHWPVVATSFAVLFLAEDRTPVLVAKLAYGPPAGRDWDNQRDAVRHLVEFGSRELFAKKPLAWQVFDVRRRGDLTGGDVKALAATLGEAPVVFFNGHTIAPRGKEEAILKEYLARGGFVFAEACCGDKRFDADFRALMKRLFPDDPLRPLPPDHPLWKASRKFAVGPKDCPLEGITRGGRTAVVYSPKPLAGYWEAGDFGAGRGRAAFQVGASVIAYATGRVPPPPRGHSAKAPR